jgi:hypothetical protein
VIITTPPKITLLIDHPDVAPSAPRMTQADQQRYRAITELSAFLESPAGRNLPEAERGRLAANLRALLDKDQAAIDAKHGVTKTPLDWAELASRQDQRQKRAFAVANYKLDRTSRLSNFDGVASADEARELQKELREKDADFIRPDDGPAYAMPKPPSIPAVQSKRETARRGHGAAPEAAK